MGGEGGRGGKEEGKGEGKGREGKGGGEGEGREGNGGGREEKDGKEDTLTSQPGQPVLF